MILCSLQRGAQFSHWAPGWLLGARPGRCHGEQGSPPPRAPAWPCAPNKVFVEAQLYHVSRPGGGAGLGDPAGGLEEGRRARAGARARRLAMIASCLCYLLLPAARLFRALSGTGPASRQAGARPGPTSAGSRGARGGVRRVGPHDHPSPAKWGGGPRSPVPALDPTGPRARPTTLAGAPPLPAPVAWWRPATVNAGGGRRRGRSRPSRVPGVYRFQGSAESLPWGLGEGWQLGSRRTPELSGLGWGVVSVGRIPAGTCPPPGYSTLTFPSRLSARSPAASLVETPLLTTQRPFPTQL